MKAVRKQPIDTPGELAPVDPKLRRRAGHTIQSAAQQLQCRNADIVIFLLLPGKPGIPQLARRGDNVMPRQKRFRQLRSQNAFCRVEGNGVSVRYGNAVFQKQAPLRRDAQPGAFFGDFSPVAGGDDHQVTV